MSYSVARFIIEFWRDDPRGQILGISTSQFIAIVLFGFGLGLTIYELRRKAAAVEASADKVPAHIS
jgi:phosphatidylglycerol:prolipoprotein diacylglycerol transferase